VSPSHSSYQVNPEIDLIPVCPNCHAMLHRPKEVIRIEDLKEMYHEAKESNN